MIVSGPRLASHLTRPGRALHNVAQTLAGLAALRLRWTSPTPPRIRQHLQRMRSVTGTTANTPRYHSDKGQILARDTAYESDTVPCSATPGHAGPRTPHKLLTLRAMEAQRDKQKWIQHRWYLNPRQPRPVQLQGSDPHCKRADYC